MIAAMQRDFSDWLYRNSSLKVRANHALKVYAGPDMSAADFMTAYSAATRDARDKEVGKQTTMLDRQLTVLQDKLAREERELRQDEQDLQNRNLEAGANLLEIGAGLIGFGRKKSVTTQFTKHRLSQSAKSDVDESRQLVEQYRNQIAELQKQRDDAASASTAVDGRAQ
jgi:hypothetical protein